MIQDYLVYLVLKQNVELSPGDGQPKDYLQDARIRDFCRVVLNHPWLGNKIYLDAIRLDVGAIELVDKI